MADTIAVVSDPAAIERVLEWVRQHNTSWRGASSTYPSPQIIVEFRADTTFAGVLSVGPDWIAIRDAGDLDDGRERLRSVNPTERARLLALLTAPDVDAAMRDSVIDGAIAKLRELYVFPETAEAMALALDRRRRAGDYDSITRGREFAALLTTHLREVSQDLHLRVDFTPAPLPRPSANPPNPADDERFRSEMERTNCGFEPTQILEGDVGYLKFNFFAPPAVCGPTASAAMNSLQDVDALIVDMRENSGGDPAMVAYVTTYLFAEPTHLNDIYNRSEDSTQEWWTLPDVPGARFVEQPVYVLTSRRTFSAAEEFSYNLRTLGRATLVGERTGGGAHPVRGEWLNDRFIIGVPFARAINPITNTNWEGTGVEPHVDVPAAAALGRARALAAAQLADAR